MLFYISTNPSWNFFLSISSLKLVFSVFRTIRNNFLPQLLKHSLARIIELISRRWYPGLGKEVHGHIIDFVIGSAEKQLYQEGRALKVHKLQYGCCFISFQGRWTCFLGQFYTEIKILATKKAGTWMKMTTGQYRYHYAGSRDHWTCFRCHFHSKVNIVVPGERTERHKCCGLPHGHNSHVLYGRLAYLWYYKAPTEIED